MLKPYDLVVYIGRFQPYHNGHHETFKQACEQSERVLFLVGSCNVSPNIRNPWSFTDRKNMILAAVQNSGVAVDVAPLNDYLYSDNDWVSQVQRVVRQYSRTGEKIAIIGFNSDHTSYYLDLFPQWDAIRVEEKVIIHATDIRNQIFETELFGTVKMVPPVIDYYINNWFKWNRDEYYRLQREKQYIEKYKKSWAAAPYPVTFTTVDAVVVQSGHVLMVQRKAAPGEGLWALPGGFLNQHETLLEGCIRELREETKLKVPAPVLVGNLKEARAFDRPERSLRGRTITYAHYIELPPGELPKVKGSDDAKHAQWVTFDDFLNMERETFEDHHAIIRYFTKL
jgi:bifunctional NMN adenylyltransferase/nudix hydrolase